MKKFDLQEFLNFHTEAARMTDHRWNNGIYVGGGRPIPLTFVGWWHELNYSRKGIQTSRRWYRRILKDTMKNECSRFRSA